MNLLKSLYQIIAVGWTMRKCLWRHQGRVWVCGSPNIEEYGCFACEINKTTGDQK